MFDAPSEQPSTLDDIDTIDEARSAAATLQEEITESAENEDSLWALLKKILVFFGIDVDNNNPTNSTEQASPARNQLPDHLASNTFPEGENTAMKNQLDHFSDRALSVICKLPGNANREVAIVIPKTIDLRKVIDLIFHFHGLDSQDPSFTTHDGRQRFPQSVEAFLNSQINGIFIYPLNAPTAQNRRNYNYEWMDGSTENMTTLVQNVDTILSENGMNISRASRNIILEGHSAGGSPATNALEKGFIGANRCVMMDATYGKWLEEAYETAIQNNPNIQFQIFYKPNTDTEEQALMYRGRPNVTLYTMAAVNGYPALSHGDSCSYIGGLDPDSPEAQARRIT